MATTPRSRTAPNPTLLARLLGAAADRTARGAGTGERINGWWLGRLPEGWFVFHDVPVGERGASVHHLVIGPGGVFTVGTKHLAGEIVVYPDVITHDGTRTSYLADASAEARRAAFLLSAAIGRRVEVRGVLAILADEWTIVGEPADMIVRGPMGAKNLMLRQPPALRPTDVIVLAAAANRLETWTAAPAPERCPCGGQMVPRTRRADGERFLGCSRFPTCRRTRTVAA